MQPRDPPPALARPSATGTGAAECDLGEAAFELRPAIGAPAPIVFSSPHSGRLYPHDMMAASALGAEAIRRSEDVLVDALLEAAPGHGVALVCARFARAYVDLNRDANELDPTMYEDELPSSVKAATARVAAGLGAIARVVGEGQEIYARKLRFSEASRRIETVHHPYHQALGALVEQVRGQFGRVALIDWHSMPSMAARPSRRARGADMVLGDRFGASCGGELTALLERELRRLGYEVARNAPYAGGYTTQRYGSPGLGVHALQVEINRGLYLDEATLQPTAGFARLREDLGRLAEALSLRWREAI
jgi:N-formylglutamate amidohydrolase